MTALVTCGQTRAALAAVRSLGRAGIAVAVAAPHRPALAMWSRYTTSTFVVADPATSPRLFADQIAEQVRGRGVTAVLSATNAAVWALSRFRDALPDHARARLPPHDAVVRAVDRPALHDLASSIGIRCVESLRVDAKSALEPALRRAAAMGMPCLVRPLVPWTEREDGTTRVPDAIAVDRIADLRRLLYGREDLVDGGCVIEPRPAGRVLGYGAVAVDGKPLAEVFQERVRERDALSGASTAAKTVPIDPRVRDIGRRLLAALSWQGPAMVELIEGRDDGALLLVGFTGRLWGSVQLSIRAGVDVPLLWYRHADGERVAAGAVSRAGVGFRWLVGDALQAWGRVTGPVDARDGGIPVVKRAHAVKELVGAPRGVIANDVLDVHDPMPFLFELQAVANRARKDGGRG